MSVSIIIPTLNEEIAIKDMLERLQPFRKQGCEIIVVDGGSQDQTCTIASALTDVVIQSKAGRALQMNSGAIHASQNILWFLHADTLIPDNAIDHIQNALNKETIQWGRFNVKLSGTNWLFRVIETMMNVRSCITGITTGDQGIFVTRKTFESVKGFSEIPLMEDIDFSKKLKKISKPICLKDKLITSSRRWEENGILSTALLMWRLRFLYFMGVSAEKLASQYKCQH